MKEILDSWLELSAREVVSELSIVGRNLPCECHWKEGARLGALAGVKPLPCNMGLQAHTGAPLTITPPTPGFALGRGGGACRRIIHSQKAE